jgi:hypothetical protein
MQQIVASSIGEIMSNKARIPMTLEITYKSDQDKPLTLDEIANIVRLLVESSSNDELEVLNYHWEANY